MLHAPRGATLLQRGVGKRDACVPLASLGKKDGCTCYMQVCSQKSQKVQSLRGRQGLSVPVLCQMGGIEFSLSPGA